MSEDRIPDHLNFERYEFKSEKCDLNDFSKLKIANGRIYFGLYQQDGSVCRMEIEDTYQNRLYVSWMQIHDRYPPPFVHPDEIARWETDGGRA